MVKNYDRKLPIFANINLLGKCNVDCYFCLGKDLEEYISKHNQLKVHFSEWKNFEQFLTKCVDNNIQRLYITGQNTDALLYKYLDELIEYLQGRGFDVGLRTNGYLADKFFDTMNKCERNIGYSIHSLTPETNYRIMKKRDIPDWPTIFEKTKNFRVSIVLCKENFREMPDIMSFVHGQKHRPKYLQIRKVSTDTRKDELAVDQNYYEAFLVWLRTYYEKVGEYYGAQVYNYYGMDVIMWPTVETNISSFNYFTDGTISDMYFIVEGYLKNFEGGIE